MEYDNTNRGSLFKNDKKEQDSHADYNGSINIEGTEFWLNAWVKESKKDGKKYFSLSVKPKQQQNAPQGKSAPAKPKYEGSKVDDNDEQIPF